MNAINLASRASVENRDSFPQNQINHMHHKGKDKENTYFEFILIQICLYDCRQLYQLNANESTLQKKN